MNNELNRGRQKSQLELTGRKDSLTLTAPYRGNFIAFKNSVGQDYNAQKSGSQVLAIFREMAIAIWAEKPRN